MSKAEEIVGVRYSEMNEKQKRIYHNTLRNESHRRNKDKVKEQNRKYREQKKQYITKLEMENKILAKALELMSIVLCTGARKDLENEISKFSWREDVVRFFKQQAEKELKKDE